jgi:putative two-component system response regulator
LETLLTERTEALRRSEEKLRKNNDFLINSLSTVVEFRNLESGTHIQRVKLFTGILLAHVKQQYPQYHLTEEQIEMITGASTLHDIGKIAILDRILLKPGKLTESETEEMRKHTVYGCRLLEKCHQEDSEFYKYCYEICRWHHERADGRGYPDGLSEKEIPIWAQVVSIADVFDALVSRRVYKPAYDVQEAVWMIRRGECGQFSDAIMDCFALAKEELVAAAFGEAREPVTEG